MEADRGGAGAGAESTAVGAEVAGRVVERDCCANVDGEDESGSARLDEVGGSSMKIGLHRSMVSRWMMTNLLEFLEP